MELNPILLAALIVTGIGIIAGVGLSIVSIVFAVPTDERVEKVTQALPGANCGSCGYTGCSGYAEAIVKGEAKIGLCAPGGQAVAEKIAGILGTEAEKLEPKHAVVLCRGCAETAARKMDYVGLDSCAAAVGLHGGPNKCKYGCVGLGDCVSKCSFNAIKLTNGIPNISPELCTGCGNCASACPKSVIELIADTEAVAVRCKSHYPEFHKEAACSAGCHSCGKCVEMCPAHCIEIVDNLPIIDYSRCAGCRVCTIVCGSKVLQSID